MLSSAVPKMSPVQQNHSFGSFTIFWHIKKSVLTDSPDNLLKVGSVHLCSH